MADFPRMADADCLDYGWHLAGCAVCQSGQPCETGKTLMRPIVQRLADKIDADALVYAEQQLALSQGTL